MSPRCSPRCVPAVVCPPVRTRFGIASGGDSGSGRHRQRGWMSTATVMQAYRFALDPSAAQARDLERPGGAARFAFNWALAQVKANIGQRTAERSCGVDGEDLTAALGWNLPALRRAWNAAKSNPRSPRGGVSA